jgi:hypothetical protein
MGLGEQLWVTVKLKQMVIAAAAIDLGLLLKHISKSPGSWYIAIE